MSSRRLVPSLAALVAVLLLAGATLLPAALFTGRVLDDAGAPVAGAQVLAAALTSAVTDGDGRYTLAAPRAVTRGQRVTLRVRRIGYDQAERTVRVESDTVRVDFVLRRASTQLEQVTVTGAAADYAAAAPAAPEERRSGAAARRQDAGATVPAAAPVAVAPSVVGSAVAGQVRVAKGMAGVRMESSRPPAGGGRPADPRGGYDRENYARIYENPFAAPRVAPLSTFSIDVDHASYGIVRRFIAAERRRPPADAVRIEELVNYFTYDYPEPTGDAPFSVTSEVAAAPWSAGHQLVRIGLQGRRIAVDRLPPNNLVFLIDVSGSMMPANKLPLLKQAFRLLVNELRAQDRVAIVVYAGAAGLVLPPTAGSEKERILAAIDRLEAGGSTAGGEGLRLAYDVAARNFRRGANNRVVLATDGDFNVGESSDAAMVRLVEQRREEGTSLTVLGVGTGNLQDAKMEQLADKGNGNYAYLDNLLEAQKALVHEMGGTLTTIAKDVKLQVEFNPRRVAGYRLVGYENRRLRDEDFNDDTKDAGELGAGHAVTALYEIIPVGAPDAGTVRGVDPLRYGAAAADRERAGADGDELLYVKLRYKQPEGGASRLLAHTVRARTTARPSDDFTFASAVAMFGLVLRDSEHKGTGTLAASASLAGRSLGRDPGGYRAEFVRLANAAARLGTGVDDDVVARD